MAQIIGLPKLSPTMEEGILIRWVLKEGDSVEPGDLIAEVETDKANMDFSLEDEGVLLKFLVPEGTTVRLGAPVLILGEEGEDISAIIKEAEAQLGGAPAQATAETPVSPASAGPLPASLISVPGQGNAQPSAPVARAGGRLLASPLAKSLGIELGIDLRTLQGSGPGGRIIERDVRQASGGAQTAASSAPSADTALAVVPAPAALSIPDSAGEFEDVPLSNIRNTIAQRLTAAARDIPQFRLSTSFEAAPLLAFRKRLNELMAGQGKVSVNDMLVKGVALALRKVPEVNVAFLGDAVRHFQQVHVGVAVALERGLMTPVVRNADLKGLGVISKEVKDLVGRAKDRKIKAHEIQGSTFTISNLGMFGIDHFDAIINPPEGAILAVGRIVKQPVFDDEGNVTIGNRMNLTMTCDHRVIDGAVGARFLDALVELLEQPESLAL